MYQRSTNKDTSLDWRHTTCHHSQISPGELVRLVCIRFHLIRSGDNDRNSFHIDSWGNYFSRRHFKVVDIRKNWLFWIVTFWETNKLSGKNRTIDLNFSNLKEKFIQFNVKKADWGIFKDIYHKRKVIKILKIPKKSLGSLFYLHF